MKLINIALNQMKIKFHLNDEFKRDPFLRWSLLISLVIEVLSLIALFLSWKKLPPLVPLFYSLPWGEEQLATPLTLLLFLLSGFFISLINLIVAYLVFSRSKFLAHILLAITVMSTCLICVTTVQILFMII